MVHTLHLAWILTMTSAHANYVVPFPCIQKEPYETLIARYMGPTWGPLGSDRTLVGPMLAPWTLLSGEFLLELWIAPTSHLVGLVATSLTDNCQTTLANIWRSDRIKGVKRHISFSTNSISINEFAVICNRLSVDCVISLAKETPRGTLFHYPALSRNGNQLGPN